MIFDFPHMAMLIFGGMFAGTVDTIIGGGGLFSVPTLLLTGLSPQATLGTNQFALSFGALVGTLKFSQKRNIKWWPETIICAIGALPGTILGGITALSISPAILNLIVFSLLVVIGIVIILKKEVKENVKNVTLPSKMKMALTFLLGVGIGFYEGFFGPGTGIIITFSFVFWLGFSYLEASGAAKVISLLGNIAAFITYSLHGDVHWIAGLIMAITVSFGAYVGAIFAQLGGQRVIRPVMLGVIILLLLNVLMSLFPHHIFN
jgi:uncharacterized membrane protein YfcA